MPPAPANGIIAPANARHSKDARAMSSQPAQLLPTGTVTFLFTDIEGSTERWEHHREAMKAG